MESAVPNTPKLRDRYPYIHALLPHEPNRVYAIPILGGLIKIFMLIPVWFVLLALTITFGIFSIINSFYVLFTGKYWEEAYKMGIAYMRYHAKIYFFFTGITDKYPGISFTIDDSFTLEMPMPERPNRFFAFPIIGGLTRIILLIPMAVYAAVLQYGALVGVIASSLPVFFSGKYSESTFEFARDYRRVSLGITAYMAGLSDSYPSFKISMNHKPIKILLLIVGTILFISYALHSGESNSPYDSQYYNEDSFEKHQQNRVEPGLNYRNFDRSPNFNVN